MPLYEYKCGKCFHVTEAYYAVDDMPGARPCEECGTAAVRVISKPNVQSDNPSWIDQSLRNMIQDDGEPPIESRTQLRKAEKEKGLVENPKS